MKTEAGKKPSSLNQNASVYDIMEKMWKKSLNLKILLIWSELLISNKNITKLLRSAWKVFNPSVIKCENTEPSVLVLDNVTKQKTYDAMLQMLLIDLSIWSSACTLVLAPSFHYS